MNFLGVDFGLRKIGIAISYGELIQPLGVFLNSPRIFSLISKICRENEVRKIVIGFSQGNLLPKVKEFSQRLSLETGLSIDFQDETLTSKEAIAKMIEGGIKKRKRKKLEDAVAAACILKEYLIRKEG